MEQKEERRCKKCKMWKERETHFKPNGHICLKCREKNIKTGAIKQQKKKKALRKKAEQNQAPVPYHKYPIPVLIDEEGDCLEHPDDTTLISQEEYDGYLIATKNALNSMPAECPTSTALEPRQPGRPKGTYSMITPEQKTLAGTLYRKELLRKRSPGIMTILKRVGVGELRAKRWVTEVGGIEEVRKMFMVPDEDLREAYVEVVEELRRRISEGIINDKELLEFYKTFTPTEPKEPSNVTNIQINIEDYLRGKV